MTDSDISEDPYALHIQFYTDKSILCRSGSEEHPLQFITFKEFSCAQDIFDTFDFTVCMGAFDFETEEFILHEEFLKHNSQRYIKFNTGTAFPLISALRMNKYKDKGYYVSKSEFLRCVLTCAQLDLNSWEDAKSHIGGMYGYALEDMFDQDKKFSIDELIEQLDKVFEVDIPCAHQNLPISFNSIMEKVFPDIVEEVRKIEFSMGGIAPKFDTSKYYYKCVDEDFKSYYKHNSVIHYKEGTIVNGGERGIFVHSDPHHPYIKTKFWVELETFLPFGEAGFTKSVDELVLHGDVKVVRQFEYDCSDNNTEQAWEAVLYPDGETP